MLESLENIHISPENNLYTSVEGVVFTMDMKELVAFPKGRSGHYAIPEGVEIIRNNVFQFCKKLSRLSIPDSVTIIGRQAISDSKILHIDINQTVSRQIDELNFMNFSWENEGGFEIKDDVVIGYYGVGG